MSCHPDRTPRLAAGVAAYAAVTALTIGAANPASAGNFSFPLEGRLTEKNGKPVDGPVALSVSFYRVAEGGTAILTLTDGLGNVTLQEGIFQLRLSLTASDYQAVFPSVVDRVFVEVTDVTHAADKPYARYEVGMTPFAGKIPVDDKTIYFDSQGRAALQTAGAATSGKLLSSDGSGGLTWIDPPSSTVVDVGGVAASAVASAATAANAAASLATPSTIVKRDANGGFTADNIVVAPGLASRQGLVIKGAAAQTASMQEWQNSSGDVLTAIDETGALKFSDGSSNYVSLKAPTGMAGDIEYTLPDSPVAGYFLTTDGDGVMSWAAPAGGGNMNASTYDINTNGIVDKSEDGQKFVNGSGWAGSAPASMTALTADLNAAATTATVTSTASYPSSGILIIDNEVVSYTGKTATTFTGLTRAVFSTVDALHTTGASINNFLFTAAAGATSPKVAITGQGRVGIGTFKPTSMLETLATSNIVAQVVRGSSSQTADLQQWQANGGAILSAIDKDGNLALKGNASNYMTLKAGTTMSGDLNLTLPSSAGSNGDVLQTNGSGVLAWTTMVSPSSTATLTNKSIDAANNTVTNLDDAAIKSTAAIARTKLASGTADHVLINNGSGVMTSEASLAITRGGTGAATASGARTALSAAALGANSDITSLSGLTTALSLTQGGTGATTASAARTALSAAASGANSDITSMTGLTTALSLAQGGTGATSASAARTALSAAASGANSDITSMTGLTTALSLAQGGTGATTASAARSALAAAAAGANSDITSMTGLTTALSLTQGGTGATTASAARTALSAASSGANSDITSMTGLTTALSLAQGGTGATSASDARAALSAAASGANSDITSMTGLTTALSLAQGGTGATTASAARSALSAAAAGANSDITAMTGLTTALSLAQGGTGATTASAARTALAAAAAGANADITSMTGLTTALSLSQGGTGATSASAARTALSAAGSGANSDITSLTGLTTAIPIASGGTGATSASAARTALSAAGSGANSDITSMTGLTTALSIAQGGTGDTTAAGARSALSAAGSGANSDITSLTGLTTALSVAQGGSGASALAGYGALVMNAGGTAATSVAPGSSGNILTSNGTSWTSAAPATANWAVPGTIGSTTPNTAAFSTVTTTGAVGIGTAAPAATLHQDAGTGTATAQKFTAGTTTGQTATDGFDIGIDSAGIAEIRQRENSWLKFYTNNTQRFSISSTGAIIADGGQIRGISTSSASTPSFAFASDTNAGIFNPSSGILGLTTAGTERMRIDASGNIGIGNSAPVQKLDVNGSAQIKATATSVLTGSIDPVASTTVTGVGTFFTTQLAVGDRILVTGQTRTVTAIASNTSLTVDTAFSDNANDTSPDRLPAELAVQNSSGTTHLMVQDSGNVGIGTAAPASKLHVDGAPTAAATSATVQITNGNAYAGGHTNGQYFGINAASGNTANLMTLAANGSTTMEVRSSGAFMVGTGTAGASSADMMVDISSGAIYFLHSKSPSGAIRRVAIDPAGLYNSSGTMTMLGIDLPDATTGTGGLAGLVINKTGTGTGSGAKTLMDMQVAGSSKLLVSASTGYVGVNTSSPQTALDINGAMRLAKNASAPFACAAGVDGALALTSVYTMCVCKGGTPAWVLTSDGSTACTW